MSAGRKGKTNATDLSTETHWTKRLVSRSTGFLCACNQAQDTKEHSSSGAIEAHTDTPSKEKDRNEEVMDI